MYILKIEEDVAANLGHEALADVATRFLYNIFCAGCQAIFLGRDFFSGRFFSEAIFLARFQKGVPTASQPNSTLTIYP